ncbi:MAG: hypothetical protein IJU81_07050 [Bacteroidales bacterium]|nr:hypothetical protein [Bacteroidales bacterium]
MTQAIKITTTVLTMLALITLSTACKRDYEEFYFVGRVVGAELCSARTMGYMIEVEKPAGIGDTITVPAGVMRNAVMAYRSPRKLVKDQRIYGVGYLTEDFAALNCLGMYYYTLPEMILLSVDEDSNVFVKPSAEGKSRSVCAMPRRENEVAKKPTFSLSKSSGSLLTLPRPENEGSKKPTIVLAN